MPCLRSFIEPADKHTAVRFDTVRSIVGSGFSRTIGFRQKQVADVETTKLAPRPSRRSRSFTVQNLRALRACAKGLRGLHPSAATDLMQRRTNGSGTLGSNSREVEMTSIAKAETAAVDLPGRARAV